MGTNPTLVLTIGLPRSGKSTWALNQAKEYGHVIVCADSLRLAITGQKVCWPAEAIVWATAQYMVKAMFYSGHPVVILDACNLRSHRRLEWVCDQWKTVLHLVPTGVDECLQRAIALGQIDLLDVIRRYDAGREDPRDDLQDWEYV